MRIAIDAHSLDTQSGGNEVYTENLINSLSQLDKENEYLIYTNPKIRLNLPINYKIIKIHTKNRLMRSLYLSNRVKKDSPDIYHGQYFLPLFCNCHSVITIHDVSFRSHPEWFTNQEKIIFKFVNNSLKKSKRIIAVSNFTKGEILRFFDINENKISVIYNGVSDIFRPNIDDTKISKVKAKYSLPDNFILYVGRFNVRKNISTLVKAFSIFKKQNKSDFKLILVGKYDWKSENLKRLIIKLYLSDEIKFINYLPYVELPLIYNAAKLFVFTSFYEGFGLPPLEAMACGIPTITSDIPVFCELIEDANIKVNPYDTEGLAKVMGKLTFDEHLRKHMVSKGLEIANRYRWKNTARETLNIYKELIK